MNIIVVDDHKMFLDGVKNILQDIEDINVTHTTSSGNEALEILKKHAVDVLISDISMPEMTGKALCKAVKKVSPKTRTLVVTMHDDIHHITTLLEAGASGYILKNTGQKELITAIRAIYQGKTYYSDEVKNAIMDNMSKSSNPNKINRNAKLTDREIEIVKLIATEHTTQEIADKLFISMYTVESHRKNIMRKTDVRNMVGLIKYVLQNGIIG